MASNPEMIKSIDVLAFNALHEKDRYWQVYEAALMYAKAGIAVVPLREDSKLLPEAKYGINYGSASTNNNTIEKWFNPATGRFRGWNVGIATGKRGGVFVLDVDKHGDIDGEATLRELELEHGKLSAPRQTTPGGGIHYVFQWEDNARSSTGKIGPGLDTRGGDENAYKAHIVAFPSIIGDRQYEWIEGGPVPLVPSWIMDRMGTYRKETNYGRGNEEVGQDDIEDTIPVEQLRNMLDCIDPDELTYEQWLRIGQAINSQYHDEEGLKIWDNWSQRGDRYKDNECRVRWRGFDPAGAVRSGTLFYFAKKGGWEPKDGESVKAPSIVSQIIEELNEEYAIAMVGGKIRILQENPNPALLTDNKYNLMDIQSFKTLMLNRKVIMGGKPISVGEIWLGHPARREYPKGLVMDPSGDAPEGAYNTWAGLNVEPIAGASCQLFLKHIKEIICGGDKQIYIWVLDWLADLFQDPANPKGCAIVMRGAEGAGKGTLANTIGEMFGPHYRHLIDDSHLLSNFNAHMIDAVFVFADEITWGGNKKTAGKLKGMVTEKYLVGERKGVDAVGYRNMTHMMIASNSEWVIPAGSNSRRWLVLDVVDHKTRDHDYFQAIYSELENGGKEALLHLLLHRNIVSQLTRAPETEALQEQRHMSIGRDTIINWWVDIVEREDFPIPDVRAEPNLDNNEWPKFVLKSELHSNYEEWCLAKRDTPLHLVTWADKMKYFGFNMKSRPRIGGKKIRAATVPSLDTAKKLLAKNYNIRID